MSPREPGSGGVYAVVVSRPVAVSMAFLAAVVFGIISYTRLPLNLFPDLTYPTLTVRTEYPGAAPEEVETQICRTLEEELSTIPSLVEISSISRAELGDVVLEFDWNADMDEVAQMVRERLARMRLPEEARRPLLLRYDPSLDPILRIGLSGGDDLFLQRHMAEDTIRRRLEVIPGVAAVKVRGGLEREVSIELDQGLLAQRGLTVEAVGRRLAAENVNLSGGSIKEGDTEYLIRTLNEFRSAEEIADVLIPCADGSPVRLGDLGTVRATHREREVVGHIDGEEAVEIAVYREADANIVGVARAVDAELFGSPAQQRYVAALRQAEKAGARTGDEDGGDATAAADGASGGAEEAAGRGGSAGAKDKEDEGKKDEKDKKRKKGRNDGRGKKGRGPGGADGGEQQRKRMTDYLAFQLPDGMELHVIADQSRFIEQSLRAVRGAALLGGLLAVLIIYLFLRDLWSTLIISVSIPLSVVMTFAPMYLAGVSLNLMSLGGLALGIGMLVDSSIVVLESIFRCREEGDGPVESAVRGTREVASAVAASTMTTVAVFLPIVFVEGVAGQLFGNLALTVVFSLLASLAVALSLIPMLAARRVGEVRARGVRLGALQTFGPRAAWRQMRDSGAALLAWVRAGRGPRRALRAPAALAGLVYVGLRAAALIPLSAAGLLLGWTLALGGRLAARAFRLLARGGGRAGGPLLRLFDRSYGAVEARYLELLDTALTRRARVLVLALVLLLSSLLLATRLGQELIPALHQGEFDVALAMPVGTPLEETLAVLDEVERRLAGVEELERVQATAGSERTTDAELGKGEHTIDLHVAVAGRGRLDRVEQRVQDRIRERLADMPGLEVRIEEPSLFSFRAPIEIAVFGHDLPQLRRTTYDVVAALQGIDDLRDVRTDLRPGYPELRIRYDREQLAARGLDLLAVAQAVRNKVEGTVATDLRGRDDRIDVRVRVLEGQVDRVDEIRRLNVNPAGVPPITLDSVADLAMDEGPSEIRHVDQRRAALVTAGLSGFDLGGASARIERVLSRMDWPPEFDHDIRGQSREMEVSLASLRFALALAVFLVYVIMASTFESLRHPFVILFSIPLAVVGVIPVLWLLHISMSVLVLIGAIVLAGIVVNNAIVLVDYVNQLRRRGLALEEALRTGGRARLRPILITTLTTALGLLPMAAGVGQGYEIRQALAVTIIAGLLASTLLTLVVVPVVYHLFAGSAVGGGARDITLSGEAGGDVDG